MGFDDLDEYDKNKVLAIKEYFGEDDTEKIINNLDNYYFYPNIKTKLNYVYYILENVFEIKSQSLNNLLKYINVERLGKDYLEEIDGGITSYGLIEGT